MSEQILSVRNVSKDFFGVYALTDVSIEVCKGEVFSLIGENGAGKSTLMNIISGVIEPTSGTLLFEGEPYKPAKPADAEEHGIAFIHQELNLFNNLSIIDNMACKTLRYAKPYIIRRQLQRTMLLISLYNDVDKG